MWTDWQSCSCRSRDCPLTLPLVRRVTDSVPPPEVLTVHYAPVPILGERSAPWKPPHSPCSDRDCCPVVVWSGYVTPQMFPLVFQSDCCCPGPGRPVWKWCWESQVLCTRGCCFGGPSTPGHCIVPESLRGCGVSSCQPAKACGHPKGFHRAGGSAHGHCNPQCGDRGTGRMMGSFPPASITERTVRWGCVGANKHMATWSRGWNDLRWKKSQGEGKYEKVVGGDKNKRLRVRGQIRMRKGKGDAPQGKNQSFSKSIMLLRQKSKRI